MNNEKKFIWSTLIIGCLSLLIPLLIHIAFSIESPEGSFLTAKWEAGDILSYCGSIIGSVIVVITVWYTLKTSNDETRKTIEASQKQFSIDMAMNDFWQFVDLLSYQQYEILFAQLPIQPDDSNLEKKQDKIFKWMIQLEEIRQKTLFHLNENELKIYKSSTENVSETFCYISDIVDIIGKRIDLSIQRKKGKIGIDEFKKRDKLLYNEYNEIVDELNEIIVNAHKELLDTIKKIIDTRLQEKGTK